MAKRTIIVTVVGVLVVMIALAFAFTEDEVAPFDEKVLVHTLMQHLKTRVGDLPVLSRISDCRTDGMTHAAVPSDLFGVFLKANNLHAKPLSFVDIGLDTIPLGTDPWVGRRDRSSPILSVSRAGVIDDQSLICLEVYAAEVRAFFFLLEKKSRDWKVVSEYVAWEQPPEEDLGPEEFVE